MTTVVEIHRNTGAGSFRFASTPIPKETHEDKNGHFQINLYPLFFIPTFILLWKFVIRIVKHLLKKKQKNSLYWQNQPHVHMKNILQQCSKNRTAAVDQSPASHIYIHTHIRVQRCRTSSTSESRLRNDKSFLLLRSPIPTNLSLSRTRIYIYT